MGESCCIECLMTDGRNIHKSNMVLGGSSNVLKNKQNGGIVWSKTLYRLRRSFFPLFCFLTKFSALHR